MENIKTLDCVILLTLATVVVAAVVASLLRRPIRVWTAKAFHNRNVVELAKSMSIAGAFHGSLLILFCGYRSQSFGLAAPLAAAWLVGGICVSWVFMKRLQMLDQLASRD